MRVREVGITAASLCVLAGTQASFGQCADWSEQFALPGVTAQISDAVVWDDGTGPALYAVGSFPSKNIGGVELTYISTADPVTISAAYNVAKWDGYRWNIVGSPIIVEQDPINSIARMNAVEVFDIDGPGPGGPVLVVAGLANTAASIQSPNTVLTFDGTTWSPLGSILGIASGTEVWDLQIFNGDLYACGRFSGLGFAHIARWDIPSQSWTDVGGSIPQVGTNIRAERMAVADADGNGTNELYVGGTFDTIGGDFVSAKRLAKWDGSAWSSVPGFTNTSTTVSSSAGAPSLLKGINYGLGSTLLVGDAIYTGLTAPALTRGVVVAALRSGAWSTMIPQTTSGNKAYAFTAAMFDGPDGQQLHIGGSRLLNGVSGQPAGASLARRSAAGVISAFGGSVDAGSAQGVRWMLPVDWDFGGPGGTKLLFGATSYRGLFIGAYAGLSPLNLALWNGTSVELAHSGADSLGLQSISQPVIIKEMDVDGPGPLASKLYIGHSDSFIDGYVRLTGVMTFDGTSYQQTPDGPYKIQAMEVFTPAGGSTNLYASGFLADGSNLEPRIFRLNGSSWEVVGATTYFNDAGESGVTVLSALESATVAGEPSLVVGGTFREMAGVPCRWIARYNGTSWLAMDAGLPLENPAPNLFLNMNTGGAQLAMVNDELFALVSYTYYDSDTTLTAPVTRAIYRWDGASWVLVTDALGGTSTALARLGVAEDGAGSSLYVMGGFQSLTGVPGADYLARWNGTSFEPVGTGFQFASPTATASAISAVGTHDFGSGPRLVAVMNQPGMSGSVPVAGLVRLEDGQWESVPGGETLRRATSLCSSTNAQWGGLYVGGEFRIVNRDAQTYTGFESQGIAWLKGIVSCDGCPACPADFDDNGGIDGADLAAFFTAYESGETCGDVDQNGGIDGADLAYFFAVYEAGGC